MGDWLQALADEGVLVVLTTSPAGLGHIRVMEALKEGLLPEVKVEEVGMEDPRMQLLHRISSRNQNLRTAVEFVQDTPLVEAGFSKLYRENLRGHTEKAYHRMADLVERKRPRPKKVVIVCTHFSLAHQLAVVKVRLRKETKVEVVLAVVVTDDSPQKIWGVIGADMIFTPSETTMAKLTEYMQKISEVKIPEVVVVPYPVSLRMGKRLSTAAVMQRRRQLAAGSREKLKLVIPISGAAVQLSYFQELLEALRGEAEATVVSRDSQYTHEFLDWCQGYDEVGVEAAAGDATVVERYLKVYDSQVVGVEVTKPSEQTFKALLTPEQRGGAILLFSKPVGRQERDNLSFMRRHHLIPSVKDEYVLAEVVEGKLKRLDGEFLERARSWRGLLLPVGGKTAGKAILKWREAGVLGAMAHFSGFMPGHGELADDGVKRIWEEIANRL